MYKSRLESNLESFTSPKYHAKGERKRERNDALYYRLSDQHHVLPLKGFGAGVELAKRRERAIKKRYDLAARKVRTQQRSALCQLRKNRSDSIEEGDEEDKEDEESENRNADDESNDAASCSRLSTDSMHVYTIENKDDAAQNDDDSDTEDMFSMFHWSTPSVKLDEKGRTSEGDEEQKAFLQDLMNPSTNVVMLHKNTMPEAYGKDCSGEVRQGF